MVVADGAGPAGPFIAEIGAFQRAHGACGRLAGDATEPLLGGYRLWIACACGARLDRWAMPGDVTADDAETWLAAVEVLRAAVAGAAAEAP